MAYIRSSTAPIGESNLVDGAAAQQQEDNKKYQYFIKYKLMTFYMGISCLPMEKRYVYNW